ncbi:MAG TPA: alpha/beta hydrolase, partial [Longimicrobiaceae bacterium]|nr:alpha/beta hydrolase [Longimicrobiaceae bacterium]
SLQADLGYTPLYVYYNTGLHVSENGDALDVLLERLVDAWPVNVAEIAIVGHSMGGLVARSASHAAAGNGHAWLGRLRKLVFLGTPHHGSPLERAGNRLHRVLATAPYTGPLARLGAIRSAGITDLRFGNVVEEDWNGRDRFEPGDDPRAEVPLPAGVECYAAAATTGKRRGDLRDRLLGDGLVPVHSALGPLPGSPARSVDIPPENQWIGYGMGHLDLLSRPEVYAQIRTWLAA